MDATFTQAILHWYAVHRRDLPWRRLAHNPYAVWLSEIILQQTRVIQGQAYWERFMERFPTVEDLAAADEDEVLRLWAGLGYYSRARNLHAAARQVVALGHFPDTMEEIRALKGVGPYTAAAIGSIAFGLPAAVVDGNVYRVLARYYGIDTPVGTEAARQSFTALAQSLLPPDDPASFNQGMMDFGAMQCVPVHPVCSDCPLLPHCHAARTGRVDLLPVKKAGAPVKERQLTYVYVRWQGQTLLHRRGAGDIWQGLWEPWLTDTVPSDAVQMASHVRHVLTHRVLWADFYLWTPATRPACPEGHQWVAEEDLPRYGKPRLVEALLALLPAPPTSHLAD